MFDSSSRDPGRPKWVGTRGLLAVLMCVGVAYFVQVPFPRLSLAAFPRPTVVVRSQAVGEPPRLAQGGFGFGQPELALVKQFDTDGDGRLNLVERRAARASLADQGQSARPGRRFGFGGPRGRLNAEPGLRLQPADVRSYPAGTDLYDPATLRTLFLQFEERDWEDELAAFYRTDVEVPATMVVDGRTYRDVGVHFRGNSSFRMIPMGRKHSLSLSFDFVHEEQRVGGYRSTDLMNANQDPTFLRSVLYADIARDYLPAPKANFVRVVINGESWGIYPNVQPFNKDFVHDWFKTTKGARWKVPGSPRGRAGLEYLGAEAGAYRRLYEIRTKDDPKAWSDLIELTRVLNQTPPARLEAALAPVLDVDGALKFLALDNALINNDGYWTRASDYSIYQDEKGRFHLFPHDFNETLDEIERFGPGARFGETAGAGRYELDPLIGLQDEGKPLRSRLLAVPALRARYLRYVRDIAERWLDWKTLGPIAARYQALIAADVKSDTRKLYDVGSFDAAGDGGLKAFADRRRAYLLEYTQRDGGTFRQERQRLLQTGQVGNRRPPE